jgi:hypothetical protein
MPLARSILIAVLVCAAVGCGPEIRTYRLDLSPIPEGSSRRIVGTVRLGGVEQPVDAALPWTQTWEGTSFAASLESPDAGGVTAQFIAQPKGGVERALAHSASGDAGVLVRVIERNSENGHWGVEVKVIPRVPAATSPPVAPAPAVNAP